MSKFRKKPVVIEARQLSRENIQELADHWCGGNFVRGGGLFIATLEGGMHAEMGDWIIRGVKGEFYPCKPDIFAATYEAVETDGAPADTAKVRHPHPPVAGGGEEAREAAKRLLEGVIDRDGADTRLVCQALLSSPRVEVEVCESLMDSQFLAGVTAGWNAAQEDDPNSAKERLFASRKGYLKPITERRRKAKAALSLQVE